MVEQSTSALEHARDGHVVQVAYRVWRTGHCEFRDGERPALEVYDSSSGDADDDEYLECATCGFLELERDLEVDWF